MRRSQRPSQQYSIKMMRQLSPAHHKEATGPINPEGHDGPRREGQHHYPSGKSKSNHCEGAPHTHQDRQTGAGVGHAVEKAEPSHRAGGGETVQTITRLNTESL